MTGRRYNLSTEDLRRDHDNGMTIAAVARKYGVSESMVRHRLKRSAFAVTEPVRDGAGQYVLPCSVCGKPRHWTKRPPRREWGSPCSSCAMKATRGHDHTRYRQDVNSEDLVREYQAGASLVTLAKKYDMTPRGVKIRIEIAGGQMRPMKEAQKLLSAQRQGIPVSEWTKYDTDAHIRILMSPEYVAWRKAVYERDNYACVTCGKTGRLQAHHIEQRSVVPERTFDVTNGVTLCKECHCKIRGHESEWEPKFKNLLWLRGWAVGMAALYMEPNRREPEHGRREAR